MEQFLQSRALSSLCKAIIDGLVIGEQVKLTLMCVVAETQFEVPPPQQQMRCEETDSSYTPGARGFSITEACSDGLTQFGAVVQNEGGAFSSEGNARCAA